MEEVSKSAALECLENDWSKYVGRYGSLPQEGKEKFLKQQGFASFSDLLSHIIAWWEEAIKNIRAVMENPDFKTREYDVDQFNVEAIKRNKGKAEKEIIHEFENTRSRLLGLVSTLNDVQIKNGETQKQLYWIIANHYKEHQL